jgi:hypothetical protein
MSRGVHGTIKNNSLESVLCIKILQNRLNIHYLMPFASVGCGCGKWGGSKANTIVGSIKDRIKPLKKSVTVDKVEARSGVTADVFDD